jgi:hypothetical protein
MRIISTFIVLLPALAFADEIPTVGEEIIRVDNRYLVNGVNTSGLSYGSISERSVSRDQMIIDGLDLGGELRLLTSPSFAGESIAITDIAFMTLRARKRLGAPCEVNAAVDVLPKQAGVTDELVWQSASAGVAIVPGTGTWAKRHLALFAASKGGVLVDRAGYWGNVGLGAIARKNVHDIVRFEGTLSALGTKLWPDANNNSWLVETTLGGTILFREPDHGWAGGWLGFSYSLPVAHAANLDPKPRLDLEIGSVLSFMTHWDLFAKYVVIDRGDADQMATQLPVLDGGFDQRQLIFGVTWHSSSNASDRE